VIKVLIGYRVLKETDIETVFLKLRAHAMTYPGYVGSENLKNLKDRSIVAMIQTWESVETWESWEASTIKRSILKEAQTTVAEEPRVTIYRVLPTSGWGLASRDS
jgi:heme-degrading monooxygenase HmoA